MVKRVVVTGLLIILASALRPAPGSACRVTVSFARPSPRPSSASLESGQPALHSVDGSSPVPTQAAVFPVANPETEVVEQVVKHWEQVVKHSEDFVEVARGIPVPVDVAGGLAVVALAAYVHRRRRRADIQQRGSMEKLRVENAHAEVRVKHSSEEAVRVRGSRVGDLAEKAPHGLKPRTAGWDDLGVPATLEAKLLDPRLQGARVTVRGPADEPPKERDVVDCTVFAPPLAVPNDVALVQVFVHLPDQAADARALATEFDSVTERRGFTDLEVLVARGDRLGIELRMPSLDVHDPVRTLVWRGEPKSVQFEVAIPASFEPRGVIGTVTISLRTVPIGHIKFKMTITKAAGPAQPLNPTGEAAARYRSAFVSYASADRREVLKRVQALKAVRIETFQDVLDLDPGARWEREIYRRIDECDVFFLFWSGAAKRSEWVRREASYALHRQQGNEMAPPEIMPLVIETPMELPWEELSHLNFSKKMVHFIDAEA